MARRIPFLHRFYLHQQAAVLVEFAIVAPVLLLLLFGTIEMSRYMLFKEKMESSAAQMLDIITQSSNVNATSLNNLYSMLPVLMEPYVAEGAHHVVTHVVRPPVGNCQPVVTWQYFGAGSRIGSVGSADVDLGDINLTPGDNVMAIEIFAFYSPLLSNSWTDEWFKKSATGAGGASGFTVYVLSYGHTRYGSFNLDPVTGRSITPPCIAPK